MWEWAKLELWRWKKVARPGASLGESQEDLVREWM